MSNKDEELLESILRETEGRHAQRPVQQPAEQSREQYGAEPASASEPGGTFSDGTEQVQPAEQSAASAQQQESSQTQTEEPAEQAVSEAEALEPQPEMTGNFPIRTFCGACSRGKATAAWRSPGRSCF